MNRMNGFLFSMTVAFAIAIVQLMNVNVDLGTSDTQSQLSVSVDFGVTDAHAEFCDRQDDPAQCKAGKIAAPGMSAFKAATSGKDCESNKGKAQDQCRASSLNPSFVAGCQKKARRIKCKDEPPVCGDGKCEKGETKISCPDDCGGSTCGDGTCDSGEHYGNCKGDCPTCGDGDKDRGETCRNCRQDMPPGRCDGPPPPPPSGPKCGDNTCDEAGGEDFETCPKDCLCGNGTCDEGEMTCAGDCNKGGVDDSNYEECCLLEGCPRVPPGTCKPACEPEEAKQICENERGEYLIVSADIVCEKVKRGGKSLKAPAKKVENNNLIPGVGNDMLVVIVLLVAILAFLFFTRKKKAEKKPPTKGGPATGGTAPGSR